MATPDDKKHRQAPKHVEEIDEHAVAILQYCDNAEPRDRTRILGQKAMLRKRRYGILFCPDDVGSDREDRT